MDASCYLGAWCWAGHLTTAWHTGRNIPKMMEMMAAMINNRIIKSARAWEIEAVIHFEC